MDNIDKLLALTDVELQRNGVCTVKVSDGHVFFFTTEKLEQLWDLARSSEMGRIMVFVKTGPLLDETKLN
jgi:hypothetical protein